MRQKISEVDSICTLTKRPGGTYVTHWMSDMNMNISIWLHYFCHPLHGTQDDSQQNRFILIYTYPGRFTDPKWNQEHFFTRQNFLFSERWHVSIDEAQKQFLIYSTGHRHVWMQRVNLYKLQGLSSMYSNPSHDLHTQPREHKPLISSDDGTSPPPPSFWTSPSRRPTPRPPLPWSRAASPSRPPRRRRSSPWPPSGTPRLSTLPCPRSHLAWCRHRVSRLNSTVSFTGKKKQKIANTHRLGVAKTIRRPTTSIGMGLLSKTFVQHDSLLVLA